MKYKKYSRQYYEDDFIIKKPPGKIHGANYYKFYLFLNQTHDQAPGLKRLSRGVAVISASGLPVPDGLQPASAAVSGPASFQRLPCRYPQ